MKPVVIFGLAGFAASTLFGFSLLFAGVQSLNLAIDAAFSGE